MIVVELGAVEVVEPEMVVVVDATVVVVEESNDPHCPPS